MANKLALATALLVALVALASATTYTTTVTTTTYDEANPQPGRQCQQQLQGRQFRACQRYLSPSRRPYLDEVEGEEFLEMTTENPQEQQKQQRLRECCEQLQRVNEQCRCEAVRQAVRQQQQHQEGGSYQERQMQEVYQKARTLPSKCNLRPQQCQIRAVFV